MIFRRKKQFLDPDSGMDSEQFMKAMVYESIKERKWKSVTGLLRATALLMMAGVGTYIALKGSPNTTDNIFNVPHTAIIKINGAIDPQKTANADQVYKLLEKAFENKHADAVILSINSPGGSPVQAGRIYDDILAFKEAYDKPVYAYIDDIGTSAGYYIALAADEIYANRASIVGSIGVISSSFGFADTIDAFGVERRVIKSGENKSFLDPFTPMEDFQIDFWQNQLSITHQQFIDRVVDSRGEQLQVDEYGVFSGLMWNGEEAVRIGLIDGLSSPLKIAAELTNEPQLIEYRMKTNFFSAFSNRSPFNLGLGDQNEIVEAVLSEIGSQSFKLK